MSPRAKSPPRGEDGDGGRASKPRAPRTKKPSQDERLDRIEASVLALRDDLAAWKTSGRETGGAPAEHLPRLVADLGRSAELIANSVAEIPRAADFQPLADHLYSFAEGAPKLLENLAFLRQAIGPLEAAAHSLGEVAETLLATQQSFSESLLRLPRAEDYEPLAAPLQEFARVSPALAETLGSVVRAVTPLPQLVEQLSQTAATLGTMSAPQGTPGGAKQDLRGALEEAAERLGAGGEAIRWALESLPRDEAYARFAAQLRELATVSPSLMEWLRQVPSLSQPLGEAVATLGQTARDLEEARSAAQKALGRP